MVFLDGSQWIRIPIAFLVGCCAHGNMVKPRAFHHGDHGLSVKLCRRVAQVYLCNGSLSRAYTSPPTFSSSLASGGPRLLRLLGLYPANVRDIRISGFNISIAVSLTARVFHFSGSLFP